MSLQLLPKGHNVALRRGLADIFYNPQDGGWYEVRDGVPVRVSGTPPRGNATVPPVGGSPSTGSTNQWLTLVNTLGSQALSIWQNSQALKAEQLRLAGGGGTAGASGQGFTGAVSQITTWMSNNPLLVAAGAVGIFLLMAPPPRRK